MRIDTTYVDSLRSHDRSDFYSEWWKERIVGLEAALLDRELDLDTFLQIPALADCGVETHDIPAEAVQRSEIGRSPYESMTDLAHRYHLHRAGLPTGEPGTLLEWGGGFGNMVRITRGYEITPWHAVVDSPIMLGLQEAYLEAMSVPTDQVLLVPHDLAGDLETDTFIACASVDECSHTCHDYLIEEVDWFSASTVFLYMYPEKNLFPEAAGLYKRLRYEGFVDQVCHNEGSAYLVLRR